MGALSARFHWSTGLVHGYMNFMKFSVNFLFKSSMSHFIHKFKNSLVKESTVLAYTDNQPSP